MKSALKKTHSDSTTVEKSPSIQPANLAGSQVEAPKPDLITLKAKNHEEDSQALPSVQAAIAKKLEETTEVLEQQIEPLTEEESADFIDFTKLVQTGLDTSRIASEALRQIRDRRLYRGLHKSFQAFCDEVLDMSEQRVSQILKCAEEIAKLQEEEIPEAHIPSTERAIRELRRVKNPKNKAEVLRIAAELVGKGPLTSACIQMARIQIEGEPEEIVRAKIVKVADVLKAAQLVKDFVETQSFDELKVSEHRELGAAVNAIAKYADKLEAQAA